MDNEKKAAIMTWYTYYNYGTALQASAICHIVGKMCYAPSLIQYIPRGSDTISNKITLNWIMKKAIKKIKKIYNPDYCSDEMKALFTSYLNSRTNETLLCRSYPELHDLNSEYDAFICGSDQIWSPLCYDDKYFLTFVENTGRMIAYAPSIGTEEILDQRKKKNIKKHISRFKYLSVREKQGATLIQSLTGQSATVVLDPTFLMSATEWDIYAETDQSKKISRDKYIICYFLGDSDKYMNYVRTLSKKMKMPFYVIPVTMKQKKSKNAVPFEVGPREFISLISCAKYVCTDSFHGAAFAINYNIPFSVFKRFGDNNPGNQNSRIFSILELLKLESRLVDYTNRNTIQNCLDCDFTIANMLLEEQREKSLSYLERALKNLGISNDIKSEKDLYKITDMCCGCGACASVCVHNAVSVRKNEQGFEHYLIDTEKCVKCGQCRTVCPMTNITAQDMRLSKALYSVKSNFIQTLKKSSSGGVAYELSKMLMERGYVVCGCAYDTASNSAKHILLMPDEIDKLYLFQGSKYIQSILSAALADIDGILDQYKLVFFGTPCQAAAVDKLLRKEGKREQCIIVDLICHGIPTYHLWDKYLQEINKKYCTGSHPNVLFRYKKQSWQKRSIMISGNMHTYINNEAKDNFYSFFRHGLCYMDSCYDCPYRERSAADLRIGDYWGDTFIKDKYGMSMVIANSNSGNTLLDELNANGICNVQKYSLDEYWSVQYPYNQKKPLVCDEIIDELKEKDISLDCLRKKYCQNYDDLEMLNRLRRIVKKLAKMVKE